MSIDSLVAERVLGWKWECKALPLGNGGAVSGWHRPLGVKLHTPAFSTDIGACFAEVVPAMRAKGSLLWLEARSVGTGWQAGFFDGPLGAAEDCGETPALAICLAALRAVGVTEEEMAL